MLKVIAYPCSKCKHLKDAQILYMQPLSDYLTAIRFKMDCCKIENVKFWSKLDVKHYIKEV